MFGLSKEQSSFQLTNKCPLCNGWPIIPSYFKPDGSRLFALTLLPLMDREALAECPKCNQRWHVFAASQARVKQPEYEISFTETSRTEEPIGEEQRVIDNSKSLASMTRRFTVTKEWTQSYFIEYEKNQADKQAFDVGLSESVSIQTVAEKSIKENYSISSESKQIYTEEILLDVPPKIKLKVVFHWKRIWQKGLLNLKIKNGQEYKVPFQIAIGITFDQTQTDEI